MINLYFIFYRKTSTNTPIASQPVKAEKDVKGASVKATSA
jgi:hypothetical protein